MVFSDALFLILREGGGIEQEALYVALGVTPDPKRKRPTTDSTGLWAQRSRTCPVSGYRRVLGFWLYPAELSLVWEELLKELSRRGVREVLCFVSDPDPKLQRSRPCLILSPPLDLSGTCAGDQTNLPGSRLATVLSFIRSRTPVPKSELSCRL